MLGGSFRVAFQSFHSDVTHINSAVWSRGVRRSSHFPVQAGEKLGTWHYFLTLLKQQPVLGNKLMYCKNYRGTKWKWTGPDQSNNTRLKHYCAVLISWGSTWTLATDCNPLGKENNNTAFDKTRFSYTEFTGSRKNNLLMWVTAVQSAYINFPFCISPVCPSSK